jgi:porin
VWLRGGGAIRRLRWIGRLATLAVWLGAAHGTPADAQTPALERQYLTGDWNGVRPLLSEHGFQPYLTYTGTMWANVNGGRETGMRFNGYLDFGADIDLAKLGAWDGLGFHADFHWYQGDGPTKHLIGGDLAQALGDWEAAATFRVFNLYVRQALADDRVVIKLGQIAADTDFMISRYGGIFLNAAFGDLPSQNLNLDAPVYPLAAPGVFASARPWSSVTARFGAYTGDAGDDVAGNHGFEWGFGNNAGYTFFSELAAAAPATWGVPATYTLGGIYDTGGSAQFGTGAERDAHYELYLMVDQALLANADGDPILGAFAGISGSPQDARNVVGIYADAGLAWFGPLPSRPKDVVGIAVSVLRFTNDFQAQEQAMGTPVGDGETVLEVTYQVQIAPWLVLQPDAQFFFDPPFSRRDAQALGSELVAIF